MFRPTPPGETKIVPGVVDRGEMGSDDEDVISIAAEPKTRTSGVGNGESAFEPTEDADTSVDDVD